MMTSDQYIGFLVLGVVEFLVALVFILWLSSTRLSDLRAYMNARFDSVNKRMDELRNDTMSQFTTLHKRIDDTIWRMNDVIQDVNELKEALVAEKR
jgi:hypothetical protein